MVGTKRNLKSKKCWKKPKKRCLRTLKIEIKSAKRVNLECKTLGMELKNPEPMVVKKVFNFLTFFVICES